MKIPLGKPIFDDEMEQVAIDTLRNERFVLGESVKKFEKEFAKYCGSDFAVSTSSGTDALKIAMLAAGINPGQTVVTSPASFIASA
ncbi:MAG TPA: aminotransferase DegT, partial [Cytophagales bacterium]|nr:aminotransferase DegT [Cytophagales bacterium]